MLRCKSRQISGFTLVELAIVLGVTGLLFGGLWRLLSTGNLQMRDQATASQQAQLIGAINTYLQSSEGQTYMGAQTTNPFVMGLPSSLVDAAGPGAACSGDVNMTSHPGLCTILPPGFYKGTTNPYGQTYQVSVLKDSTPSPAAPKSYSFMILTTSGDTIPDTSGGRISSMIGGDGGFVYTNNVCGTPTSGIVCGAYGSWSATVSTYGLSASSGVVASRTYYSPTQSVGSNWLSRTLLPGDNSTSPLYNTMQTPLFLGYVGILPNTGEFYLGKTSSATATDGGAINMQGGTINVQGGTIDLGASGEVVGIGTASILISDTVSGTTNPPVILTSSCHAAQYSDIGSTCNYVEQVNGSMNVLDLLYASQLYAGTFIYQSSDARLKSNIKTLSDPLADVMKINPVSFTYKSGGKESMGVIAQELEKVYPQLVAEGPNKMKSVTYEGLIAPLIGAVQELKKENDDLRAELHNQAIRQEKQGAELSKLQQK